MNNFDTQRGSKEHTNHYALRENIEQALNNYFSRLGDQEPTNLYELVLAEVEIPLLEEIMNFTRNNQSLAATMMGISRGTLRKKLKQYNLNYHD